MRVSLPLVAGLLGAALALPAASHPLGNFTVNHFTRIEVRRTAVHVRHVVDLAEIPTLQELARIGKGADPAQRPSPTDLEGYARDQLRTRVAGLNIRVEDRQLALTGGAGRAVLLPGQGGLPTLRIELDYEAPLSGDVGRARRLTFADLNERERMGWHETVVIPDTGISIWDSSVFGSPVTDELKAYPEGMLTAPLNERTAEFSFRAGFAPAGAAPLADRERRPIATRGDALAELVARKDLPPWAALLGLLLAFVWGAGHAFSPGHGKTVVGAYLVGSRGTIRHALFLGLTVTITHTSTVFALGLVTLFASQSILPDRLFPIMELASGLIVFGMGAVLLQQRLRALIPAPPRSNDHRHGHAHAHSHDHGHAHGHHGAHAHAPTHAHTLTDDEPPPHPAELQGGELWHSHGGATHSHLPPGTDGAPVTWKNLLALGISGGLLPCPSALIVLLGAIALHRVAYGLLLVVSFSLGLAATLTVIGVLFVYAGHLLKDRVSKFGPLQRVLPVVSALIITLVGAGMCWRALADAGWLGRSEGRARHAAAPRARAESRGFLRGGPHGVS